ncbi:hypothetical protein [Phycicoccus sp. Soil803]|uniref:hypothetical protein n=1 Tax=Phycicoccus sp. Soil803 TaxID=1736415 RepID=UPI00070EBCD1|nr:hypothetical protein [Phycicoccus sp. Soil803]KRF25022.1 hypothetical protein ASG95_11295 [Phycicoccus sp. Soil803]
MGGHEVGARRGVDVERVVVGPRELAARLEHRLHWPELDEAGVREGCSYATKVGMPVVLCRPEHVALAVECTAGSSVEVGTAPGFAELRAGAPISTDFLVEEARELVESGAAEVAIVATAAAMSRPGRDSFTAQVAAVREAVSPAGGRVRVLVNTKGMASSELASTCRELAQAGAWLVQGGTFLGDRVSFGEVGVMREALGPRVLLKWTHPVRSVEMMLICIAEGVDRFNGDPPALLEAARTSSRAAPLMVPVQGVDY